MIHCRPTCIRTHGMLDVTVDRDEWLDAFAERYFSEKKPFTMLKKGININDDIAYLLHNAKLITTWSFLCRLKNECGGNEVDSYEFVSRMK